MERICLFDSWIQVVIWFSISLDCWRPGTILRCVIIETLERPVSPLVLLRVGFAPGLCSPRLISGARVLIEPRAPIEQSKMSRFDFNFSISEIVTKPIVGPIPRTYN